jgi:uncharacterized OsmC-like protein
MSEQIIVRQDREYNTTFLAPASEDPDAQDFEPVEQVHQLNPYGMLLASVGTCTAIVLHSFAEHHGIALTEVELRLRYERDYKKDCVDCQETGRYDERIEKEIVLIGDLGEKERQTLFRVSKHCPVYKMLKNGVEIQSRLVESENKPGE